MAPVQFVDGKMPQKALTYTLNNQFHIVKQVIYPDFGPVSLKKRIPSQARVLLYQ